MFLDIWSPTYPFGKDLHLAVEKSRKTSSVWLTVLEVEDETLVRDSFTQSYQIHMDNIQSIRKMVKSSLLKDLAYSVTPHQRDQESMMRQFYVGKGDDFFVAILRECCPDQTFTNIIGVSCLAIMYRGGAQST
jgi:hypothetical protein